jgi:hypothetical protein
MWRDFRAHLDLLLGDVLESAPDEARQEPHAAKEGAHIGLILRQWQHLMRGRQRGHDLHQSLLTCLAVGVGFLEAQQRPLQAHLLIPVAQSVTHIMHGAQ